MLRLLHTADWHLGRTFPSMPEQAQVALSRARAQAVARAFDAARRNAVHAVLCAGDLFDDPDPAEPFWEELARILRAGPRIPTFLVPGNHDPLTPESVWAPHHPLRARLPPWVHVVDQDDFAWPLGDDAVLYARPCRHTAGEQDLAMALPAREPGDARIRVGCVHGTTFDLDGFETNFPIHRDAGVARGLDYLAIGDTHAFRDVTPNSPVPTVYPGTPEQTAFDERDAGYVAVVALFRPGRRPRVERERVGHWTWHDRRCRDLTELRGVLTLPDLHRAVVRLRLEMTVTLAEANEVDRIVRELEGSEAACGRAGVVVVDRTHLRLRAGASGFRDDLPPVLADAVARLNAQVEDAPDETARELALRAQQHLYRLLAALDTADAVDAELGAR